MSKTVAIATIGVGLALLLLTIPATASIVGITLDPALAAFGLVTILAGVGML